MQDSYKTAVNYFHEYKLNFFSKLFFQCTSTSHSSHEFYFLSGYRKTFSVLSGISENYLLIKCMMCYGRH